MGSTLNVIDDSTEAVADIAVVRCRRFWKLVSTDAPVGGCFACGFAVADAMPVRCEESLLAVGELR